MEILRIPRDVEDAIRDLLGHAARGESQEFSDLLSSLPVEHITMGIALCQFAVGYAAIDVVGREWPNEDNLRAIAKHAITSDNARKAGLTEQQVYDFVARASLLFEPLEKVFPDGMQMTTLPFYITVFVLIGFHPKGMKWWTWLDRLEEMYELAANGDLDVTPAFMLRARRTRLDASKPQPE